MQRDNQPQQPRPEGNAEVRWTEAEQTRVHTFRKLIAGTLKSIEQQTGYTEVGSDQLAQMALGQASAVLHNTLAQPPVVPDNIRNLAGGVSVALGTEVAPSPATETQSAEGTETAPTPLADFGSQPPMPNIEQPNYDEPPMAASV